MRLVELRIKNYKSLGDITFRPGPLSVLVGPNGAGKSNFANALSFLSEVFEHGIEMAVKRKGGYENILMRGINNENKTLELSVLLQFSMNDNISDFNKNIITNNNIDTVAESGGGMIYLINQMELQQHIQKEIAKYSIKYSFILTQSDETIKSNFIVKKEEAIFSYNGENSTGSLHFVREDDIAQTVIKGKPTPYFKYMLDILDVFSLLGKNPQKLILLNYPIGIIDTLKKITGAWSVYQLNPHFSRIEGIPTPNPEIDTYGKNLPAFVEWFKTNYPDQWKNVINVMMTVIPGLSDITTDYLHNKRLGLFFYEENLMQPWNAEEVSDGTILTLSILCAVFDIRKSLILIEEIENSLHPWVLRTLIEEIRKIDKGKNIILTTHSPLVIDLLRPEEVWCISKPQQESNIDRLVDLAPDLPREWENGDYKISDFLDSGLLPNAVPGGLL